jgi:hypothetical protein
MLPKTELPTMLVVSSSKKAVDLQLSFEEESKEQIFLSRQPKTTTTLEALSEKDAINLQSSATEKPMMIPNLLPSMRPI